MNEETAKLQLPLNENHEAFLIYNGAPDAADDPADYFTILKGVRIA